MTISLICFISFIFSDPPMTHTKPPMSAWRSVALDDAEVQQTIRGMQQYYDERATQFDQWYRREGLHVDPQHDALWHDELAAMTEQVKAFGRGRLLELASGTGWWTQQLAHRARVTALDYAPTMLEMWRRRQHAANFRADILRGDAYRLPCADASFDACFFGFWLSHVPREWLPAFFSEVNRALRRDGVVMLVDSKPFRGETPDVDLKQERILNDGSRHQIVKVYHTPATLHTLLSQFGAQVETWTTGTFFTLGQYRKM